MIVLTPPAFGQVRWERSFEGARAAAKQSGKPFLIDFVAAWCGPCRQMEEETFADRTVHGLLKRVVCLRVDVDRQPALAAEFGVLAIPRVLLVPAAGGQPVMDLQGFRDAKSFARELRDALGLRAARPASPDDPERERVHRALQDGTFAALKASDPKAAARGLDRLVTELGVFREDELPPLTALLRGAGNDAIPALVRGMGHRHLAVRAAAYRTLQELLREKKLAAPAPFDPWAPLATRQAQLRRWLQRWNGHEAR